MATGLSMDRLGWQDLMAREEAGLRQIARVMQCSAATVKKVLTGGY